ncbi:aldose 1-epimerase family protein [Streptomyces sp. NPDC000987]|uniref:aldose 1-epimerase family protein n=1 Tax=Streptomyces sp. NPDC000987 TaxID=3154374 RepID=UPI00332EDD25
MTGTRGAGLRSLSGFIVTGGLDHTLFGDTVDAADYHYPPKTSVRHGLHGRIANIPARLTGYDERWTGDRCALRAEGEVRQAAVFGEHLVLRRRIEADLGGTEIRLHDTVVNAGFERTPHMFLYHINVGWPLLDEGARVEADVERTAWSSDSVREQGVSHEVMPAPVPHFVEQVYEHVLRPAEDGRNRVRVVNDALGRGLEVEFGQEEFPHFFERLNLHCGGYAVGLEPSTHAVAGDAAARREGTMTWLEHGDERAYRTVFRFRRAQPPA